jgi:hypothetical protein
MVLLALLAWSKFLMVWVESDNKITNGIWELFKKLKCMLFLFSITRVTSKIMQGKI